MLRESVLRSKWNGQLRWLHQSLHLSDFSRLLSFLIASMKVISIPGSQAILYREWLDAVRRSEKPYNYQWVSASLSFKVILLQIQGRLNSKLFLSPSCNTVFFGEFQKYILHQSCRSPEHLVTVNTPGPELHMPRPSSDCAMASQLPFLVRYAGLWAGTCRRPRLNTWLKIRFAYFRQNERDVLARLGT